MGLVPEALAQSWLTCRLSKTAKLKSAPVTFAPLKLEKDKIASSNKASLKSAPSKVVR